MDISEGTFEAAVDVTLTPNPHFQSFNFYIAKKAVILEFLLLTWLQVLNPSFPEQLLLAMFQPNDFVLEMLLIVTSLFSKTFFRSSSAYEAQAQAITEEENLAFVRKGVGKGHKTQ